MFKQSGLGGGFYRSKESAKVAQGVPLVVIYHSELEKIQQTIIDNGGRICKAIFAFPSGRRSYFIEVYSNELGVWSDA